MIYQRKSRMPVGVQQKLLEHFVAGTTARAAALLVGMQGNTATLFYQRLRQLIASKQKSYELSGEVEADESYFRVFAKAGADAVQVEKCLSLAC